ncbi:MULTISPECIES: DUF2730 family protein [Pseudomonas]|uniref:DUF2730 domain-containing protein n=5 Tax=Pseudomonas aeruginosa TaxID=287 RepID=A0A0M4NC45_PSEAI|nr:MULTISPECIES: DUF2730 family protein [Pseudomonas]MDG0898753.1 DUF2730 family protein [Pseudomonas sp. L01]AHA21490.2 hypothetical protein PA1S_16115 [Pseudomonas aeruginosa PA1]ALE48938.1 hypothetical protein AOD73_16110 [Pseudomonas aeruginosa]ALI58972.1 hypothetical protein CCBH4851_00269 [Pseudomonas aeruginosa]KPE40885.1 hypothetical protein AOA74_01290 [Pseudomonas aeruginosa]
MDLTDMQLGFSSVQWVVMTVLGIYTWLTNRQAASSRELLELRTRIIALEAAVQHLPDQAAITELLGDMKAVRAELTAMQGLTRAVDRINDYLLRERP